MPACAVMSEKRIGPDGRADIEAMSAGLDGCIAEVATGDEGSPSREGGLEDCLQPAAMSSKQHRNRNEEDLKSVPSMQLRQLWLDRICLHDRCRGPHRRPARGNPHFEGERYRADKEKRVKRSID